MTHKHRHTRTHTHTHTTTRTTFYIFLSTRFYNPGATVLVCFYKNSEKMDVNFVCLCLYVCARECLCVFKITYTNALAQVYGITK